MPMRRRRFQQGLLASLMAVPLLPRAATPTQPLWFIFLERGKPTPPDRDAVMAMQRGHIENFKRLFALGQLFAAGPMADPAGTKRGIVVVQAPTREQLAQHFQPDAYVREGYMTLNAVPAQARKPLNTEGIDASRVEEVRIAMLPRGGSAPPGVLAALVDKGVFGAWYTLEDGPIADVLFARTTDDAALQAALGPYSAAPAIWRQWLSPGVVR